MSRSQLRRLHEGVVAADQIDHLGHMNVRFYATRAMAATHALLAEFGLEDRGLTGAGQVVAVPDTFTRHYHEQLEGAHLVVLGGVIAVGEAGLLLHHELRNEENDELAATFRHRVQLLDGDTREARPFSTEFAEVCGGQVIEWPDYGRPRTTDLDTLPGTLTLDEARARGLEMRFPRTITPEECDEAGNLHYARTMELVWGGERTGRAGGFPVFEPEDGIRFGWATLESRHVLVRPPRVGQRIQSFGAEVQIERKTSYRHNWVFDVETGHLVCTASSVNLAFDIAARRSMEIPARFRAELEASYHPDLI